MTTVTLECIRRDVADTASGAVFPMYCGFETAETIKSLAAAPAYTRATDHYVIARNVLGVPVEDWQRPIDEERVAKIATVFSDTSKLMPNPVLLAQNLNLTKPLLRAYPKTTAGGMLTGLYLVEITLPSTSEQSPLWILDGQHRIHGLAASVRPDVLMPFVLLVKDGPDSFSAGQFAEIFAQVTTEAEDLKKEHREWLSYAFHLGNYSASSASSASRRLAFETAARLCATSATAGAPSRPFLNAVKFNPFRDARASEGGFGHSIEELTRLVNAHYFATSASSHLAPIDLADQISSAYVALHRSVTNPGDSVFFGKPGVGERIMQDAFLVGCLEFMRRHGPPGTGKPAESWESLLSALQVPLTDWDFRSWSRSLSGPAQTDSRRIALLVFADLFGSATLPAPSIAGSRSPNIVDVLKGESGRVEVTIMQSTPTGSPSRAKKKSRRAAYPVRGNRSEKIMSGEEHVSVQASSPNVARVAVEVRSTGSRVSSRLPGTRIDLRTTPPPFTLFINSHLYGGRMDTLELDVS